MPGIVNTLRALLPAERRRVRGARESADRAALRAAIQAFQRRVDAALPGMYAWFSDASLHITLRALIN